MAPSFENPFPDGGDGFADVGGYQLVAELGRGGMGRVYKGHHAVTGFERAVKLLLLDEPELLERFQREAQAQAAVDGHPNVLRVYAVGVERGRAYMVMDLASGGDLEDRLKEGPMPPRDAAVLVRDLGRGLAHVHRHGVLHRDLKPSNVLFDERGVPRLTDFGLAALRGADRLTKTGSVMGTPAYMPPEQAMGSGLQAVDERADVYGLGAILYHCLTGRPPFVEASVMATLAKVVQEPPTAPSKLADVPAALEEVCLRALAKEPSSRHPTADVLADELQQFLAGGTSRSRSWIPAAALSVLVLGGGLAAVASAGPAEPEPAAKGKVEPKPEPEPEPESEPEPSRRPPAEEVTREPGVAEALRDIEANQLGAALIHLNNLAREGSAQAKLHMARIRFGFPEEQGLWLTRSEARMLLTELVKYRSPLPREDRVLLVRMLIAARHLEAHSMFERLVRKEVATQGELEELLSLAVNTLNGKWKLPFYESAERHYERIPVAPRLLALEAGRTDSPSAKYALQALQRMAESKDPEVCWCLARVYQGSQAIAPDGSLGEVPRLYRIAADAGYADALWGLGREARRQNQPEQEWDYYERAAAAGSHRAKLSLADGYLKQGIRRQRAFRLLEEAVDGWEPWERSGFRSRGRAHFLLWRRAKRQRRVADAEAHLRQAAEDGYKPAVDLLAQSGSPDGDGGGKR